MYNILGHRSWNEQEILAFFDQGSFTMCSLPHYRYQRVQMVCGKLKSCGLIEKVGRTETAVNYAAKAEYHQWRRDVKEGRAPGSLAKLVKLKNPPKRVKRKCRHCGAEFATYNPADKSCSRTCREAARDWKSRGSEAV
ncbi:MAG: hypothetical protein BGO49_28550 [Planctomycetales bacterium 71-10]|nr:MAG: hypothetical protein BGO49_28550 [Planctomycetales bacterium 71-10]